MVALESSFCRMLHVCRRPECQCFLIELRGDTKMPARRGQCNPPAGSSDANQPNQTPSGQLSNLFAHTLKRSNQRHTWVTRKQGHKNYFAVTRVCMQETPRWKALTKGGVHMGPSEALPIKSPLLWRTPTRGPYGKPLRQRAPDQKSSVVVNVKDE